MVQSPSWEANWFAASQEITRISRNPKVHYRTHKRPPPVSILGQLNPVHIHTSHLLEIHPNIIHPSTPRSSRWFFPSGFPSVILYMPLLSPTRATCPAHVILLGKPIRIAVSKLVLIIIIHHVLDLDRPVSPSSKPFQVTFVHSVYNSAYFCHPAAVHSCYMT